MKRIRNYYSLQKWIFRCEKVYIFWNRISKYCYICLRAEREIFKIFENIIIMEWHKWIQCGTDIVTDWKRTIENEHKEYIFIIMSVRQLVTWMFYFYFYFLFFFWNVIFSIYYVSGEVNATMHMGYHVITLNGFISF